MTGRQSSAVDRALRLVRQGMTPYAAARKAGVSLTAIYRACKRHRASKPEMPANGPKTAQETTSEAGNGQIPPDDVNRVGWPITAPGMAGTTSTTAERTRSDTGALGSATDDRGRDSTGTSDNQTNEREPS